MSFIQAAKKDKARLSPDNRKTEGITAKGLNFVPLIFQGFMEHARVWNVWNIMTSQRICFIFVIKKTTVSVTLAMLIMIATLRWYDVTSAFNCQEKVGLKSIRMFFQT